LLLFCCPKNATCAGLTLKAGRETRRHRACRTRSPRAGWRRRWVLEFGPVIARRLRRCRRHRVPRDPGAARYRCILQPRHLLQPQHFLDPAHRHPRSRHLLAPAKGGRASCHYLPLGSDAKADERCRGRRNRCRIGAKPPAAFRQNHLPLSIEIRCRFAPIFAPERMG